MTTDKMLKETNSKRRDYLDRKRINNNEVLMLQKEFNAASNGENIVRVVPSLLGDEPLISINQQPKLRNAFYIGKDKYSSNPRETGVELVIEPNGKGKRFIVRTFSTEFVTVDEAELFAYNIKEAISIASRLNQVLSKNVLDVFKGMGVFNDNR